jgi:hypothetical protein
MIGDTIAHFRFTARLGAGGMGEAYRPVIRSSSVMWRSRFSHSLSRRCAFRGSGE